MLLKIFSRGKGSGNAPINYLLGNDYGVLGILPPYIAKPSEAPVCRGL